jgi:hypothetical protein
VKKLSLPILLASLLILLIFAGRLAAQPDPAPSELDTPPAFLTGYPAHFWQTSYLTNPVEISGLTSRSLAIDSAGHPHMVYGRFDLYYAWHDGTNWHQELVRRVDSPGGAYASLLLDGEDNPHIVYQHQDSYWYTYRPGGHWFHIPFEATGTPSIALDSQGYLHVAAVSQKGLYYLRQTNQGWFLETVDDRPYYGWSVSLSLDQADNPHISYIIFGDHVYYAHRQGDQWQIETIAPLIGEHRVGTSLVVDSKGQPAVAFQAGQGVRFASRTAGSWDISTINGDEDGALISLTLDANDVPHLSYYYSLYSQLVYATRPADSWLTIVIDYTPSSLASSLALDLQGEPHVIYADYTGSELRYARLANNDWVIEMASNNHLYGRPRMAMDGADRLHVLYQEFPSGVWHHTYQTESSWLTEPITMAVVSFAFDVSNNLHLAYMDPDGALGYAYRDNDQWHTEIITGLFSTPVHLVLDQQQTPHVTFFQTWEGPLEYGYRTADGWSIETIDNSGGYWNRFSPLQVDSLNQPHLVYPANNRDLIYAHWQSGQWLTETLASNVRIAWLTLDSQDFPHIAYTHSQLFQPFTYTYWTGSSWSYQTIEAFHASANYSYSDFLVLDSQDLPHLIYEDYDHSPRFLRYVYKDEKGEWFLYEVEQGNRVGPAASLALNSQDMPFILQQDGLSTAVKLSSPTADVSYLPLIQKP